QIGLTPPEGRSDLTLHFTDIVSYSVGKHQFRYGAEFRHVKLNEFYHRRGTGKFVFDGLFGPWFGATGCAGATGTSGPSGCQALINGGQLPLAEALGDFLAVDVSLCSDALHVINGFAYQPTAKGDLVVRGGFGVFYDQINLNPFLDFRPPVSAPSGIQGNPFGATPVSTYSRDGYNWDAAQTGGASIFPAVQACVDP